MENLFEKYQNYIRDLEGKIHSLEHRMEDLDSMLNHRTYQPAYQFAGKSVLMQYVAVTKIAMKERQVDSVFSLRFLYLVLRFFLLLPIKIFAIPLMFVWEKIRSRRWFIFPKHLFFHWSMSVRRIWVHRINKREKKRVAVFIPTLSALAGAENYALGIANYCLRKFNGKAEVDIICTNIFSDTPSLYDIPTKEEIARKFNFNLKDAHFKMLHLDYSTPHHVWGKNFYKVAKASLKYDLFINCQHNIYHSYAGKSVFISHFPHQPLSKIAAPLDWLSKWLFSRIYSGSYSLFVANSPYTEKWLKTFWSGISRKRIKVLCPPVLKNSDRKGSYKKEKIILTCSRIDPEKKILDLVKIFLKNQDKFSDYVFHIAGTVYKNNPDLRHYYEEIMRLAKNNPRIKIHTDISHTELISLYKKAKIYWHGMGYNEDLQKHPIRAEHFGITPIEAMTYGCIPVVHNSGGPSVFVQQSGVGAAWTDEEEAVKALSAFTRNDKGHPHLSHRAVQYSRQFSSESFIENLDNIFSTAKII